MDFSKMKRGVCTLKLEKLKEVYNEQGKIDPTLARATFSIIDFNVSGNKQKISKKVALESAFSLKNKPLLCGYIETTDYENQNDDFTTHEEYEGKLRNGEDYIFTKTHAIGVSPDKAYLGVIVNGDGAEEDVLLADFVLWKYRYPNEVSLISEFYEKEEPLYSSCEYYYSSSDTSKEDGIEVVGSLYFDGHTILGRNVDSAYSSSKLLSFNEKWNKALNEKVSIKEGGNNQQSSQKERVEIDKNSVIDESDKTNKRNSNKKEVDGLKENMFYKALCELSHADIRTEILSELSKKMTADDFHSLYLSNYGIYDSYFVYEVYEGKGYVNYKVNYTKADDKVDVDLDTKVKVARDLVWVETEVLNSSINELNTKITELEKLNKVANESIVLLTEEKKDIEGKFNNATETITSLNAKVEELMPIVDIYNAEQVEKALNEKVEFYSSKFNAVNGKDKFETEEVQELIKKSINEDEEGKEAVLSLNTMLVDMVQVKKEDKKQVVKEVASKQENLIPTGTDFMSRYGV